MLVYVILFIITFFLSSVIEKNKNKKSNICIAIVLLLSLSFFAGVRSIDLGFDAKEYIKNMFERIQISENLSGFLKITTIENGFSILSYMLYKIFPNINFLLFCYSLITTAFVMLFAFKEKENIPFSRVMIIYYLTLYLHSYNIIRQAISITIVLYAFSLFKNKQTKLSLFWLIISIQIHSSAIFASTIFILYKIIESKKNNSSKIKTCIFFLLLILLISISYERMIILAYNINLISYKYLSYINVYTKPDFNIATIAIKTVWFSLIMISLIFKNTNRRLLKENHVYIFFIFIDLIITIISIKIYPLQRITFFYYYIGILYFLPILKNYYKKNSLNQNFLNITIYGSLIIYALWKTVIGNSYAIYPYHSDIIECLNLFF